MARMERTVGLLICLLTMIMDIVAGTLGIKAEKAQNELSTLLPCKGPSYEAGRLGLAAAMLLALAHAIMNTFAVCVCFSSEEEPDKPSRNKQQLAAVSLIFSWIIFIIAFPLLIMGPVLNSRWRTTCGFSYHQMLSAGGILCFIHGLLSVAYCVSARVFSAAEEGIVNQQQSPPA
ncbi:hypothetical protein Ancab_033656 [Ancistrocladus abbreviatus]